MGGMEGRMMTTTMMMVMMMMMMMMMMMTMTMTMTMTTTYDDDTCDGLNHLFSDWNNPLF